MIESNLMFTKCADVWMQNSTGEEFCAVYLSVFAWLAAANGVLFILGQVVIVSKRWQHWQLLICSFGTTTNSQ